MAQELVKSSATEHDDATTTPVTEPTKGPGVQALEKLLAGGAPEPKKVVALIDAHRGERDAMFALLHKTLGNGYVQQVVAAMDHLRASIDRREVVAGDPSDPSGGYFIGSQKEQGARWRTSDGRFTGTAGKNGLDTSYKLDSDDTLHGRIGKDRTGTLGWEHDGKTEAELYGSYKGSSDYEVGVRRPWEVGDGTLTTGVRHKGTAQGSIDGVTAAYKNKDGSTTASGDLGVQDGHVVGSASATHKISPHDTVTGSITQDPTTTTVHAGETHTFDGGSTLSSSATVAHSDKGTTGSLTETYKNKDLTVDGSVTRALDRTSLHLGASDKITPETTVSGHLDHVAPDHGAGQTTLGLSERTRSGKLVHGLDLDAGLGERDYLGVKGSVDGQLADRLYAGGFGGFQVEGGKQTSAQVGASLTFTPSEKTALTLAGVLDQDGALETRLQLDVFKSKIANVQDLADHKKDALVSLFLSYSQSSGQHMLDQRFGAPQLNTGSDMGGGQVMAGIRIKF